MSYDEETNAWVIRMRAQQARINRRDRRRSAVDLIFVTIITTARIAGLSYLGYLLYQFLTAAC